MIASGCARVKVYDGATGEPMPRAGVMVRETEPWLALNLDDGSLTTFEVPTGKTREYVASNFLSRSSVSLAVRESGSLSQFGVDSDATAAKEALQKIASSARGFGAPNDGGPRVLYVIMRADSVASPTPMTRVIYSDGSIRDVPTKR